MIRSFFGITNNPFSTDSIDLLSFQQEIINILDVHTNQGGLCLIMGEPGTGKSVIKDALIQKADIHLNESRNQELFYPSVLYSQSFQFVL